MSVKSIYYIAIKEVVTAHARQRTSDFPAFSILFTPSSDIDSISGENYKIYKTNNCSGVAIDTLGEDSSCYRG